MAKKRSGNERAQREPEGHEPSARRASSTTEQYCTIQETIDAKDKAKSSKGSSEKKSAVNVGDRKQPEWELDGPKYRQRPEERHRAGGQHKASEGPHAPARSLSR